MLRNIPFSLSGFIIVIIIVYIWYIQFYQVNYPKIFIDDLINNKYLKTGDMVLFKAYNNFNSIVIGNYFGHMGVIYVDPNDPAQTPMMFEANGIEHMPLKAHHNQNGIFFSKFADRAKKYKGRVFIKSLNDCIPDEICNEFRQFIDYGLSNMMYDVKVFQSGLKKALGVERCGNKTNCGEIVFLSLIKLGLLDINRYDQKTIHHLKWMSNITDLDNGMKYLPPIEVIDHPFHE